MRLRVIWEDDALRELDEAARTAKQAQAVIDAVERMARVGWSYGRATLHPRLRYLPVPPFGVYYWTQGGEVRIASVVDGRRLRRLP